jgi:hypothetical protein
MCLHPTGWTIATKQGQIARIGKRQFRVQAIQLEFRFSSFVREKGGNGEQHSDAEQDRVKLDGAHGLICSSSEI